MRTSTSIRKTAIAFPRRSPPAAVATAGGDLAVEVADASEPGDDTFKLLVIKDGKVAETFDNVTVRRGSGNVVTAVRQRSKLITVEEVKSAPLAVPAKGVRTALSGGERSPESKRPRVICQSRAAGRLRCNEIASYL